MNSGGDDVAQSLSSSALERRSMLEEGSSQKWHVGEVTNLHQESGEKNYVDDDYNRWKKNYLRFILHT